MSLKFKKANINRTRSKRKIKLDLSVHCSCGKDYKIKEKFHFLGRSIRHTECPKCYNEELI